jgi:hypothetical protein
MVQTTATIQFDDAENASAGVAIVRVGDGVLALCLSLETGGDLEVFLSPDAAEQLSTGIRLGLEALKS